MPDTATEHEIPIRFTIVNPVPGVALALRGETPPKPVVPSGDTVSFDFAVRVKRVHGSDQPRFLGPYTYNAPETRTGAVMIGTLAGQADSCWTRAVKIPLYKITWPLIEEALSQGGRVEARINGRGKDGGPACATVPLEGGCWRVVA